MNNSRVATTEASGCETSRTLPRTPLYYITPTALIRTHAPRVFMNPRNWPRRVWNCDATAALDRSFLASFDQGTAWLHRLLAASDLDSDRTSAQSHVQNT